MSVLATTPEGPALTLNQKCWTVRAATRASRMRVRFGRLEQMVQQFGIPDIVLLMHPEGFEQRVRVVRLGGIKLFHPLLQRGHHLARITLTEFDARPLANSVGRMLEVLEQRRNRLPIDLHRLLQRTPGRRHPVDAAVLMVAVRIAHVVLHVADDHVVPVGDVERTVLAEDRVRRAEILVTAHQQPA